MLDINDETETNAADSKIASLLKDAGQQLEEADTRNKLIYVHRSANRANVLKITNERSDDVYEILKKSRKINKLSVDLTYIVSKWIG